MPTQLTGIILAEHTGYIQENYNQDMFELTY